MSDMRHPLARARGHGSAKHGVHHWTAQRATAVLLLLLIPWLMYSLISLSGADHAEAASYVANPWNASLLILSLLVLLYHAVLGMQVVIEDYVHHRVLELVLHLFIRTIGIIGAILGSIHILKLALGA